MKKTGRLGILVVIGLVALMCSAAPAGGATPSKPAIDKKPEKTAGKIVSWTNSRTNSRKRMFLVRRGEKITFSVKADGIREYEWRLNKKVQEKAIGDSFTWTVPDEKGIWEIHLKTTGLRRAQSSRSKS